MRYRHVIPGIFRERPNRFIARVTVEGREEVVHVKNTGRCRELLLPGETVYLAESDSPHRKTRFDLVGVEKFRPGRTPLPINLDSQAPNAAAAEWLPRSGLFSASAVFRREVTCGDSRFDFVIEEEGKNTFLEVKGVTLEAEGIAYFPDAPTERGVKHLKGLIRCCRQGLGAALLFVIQMQEVRCFRPNDAMHPEFGTALREAARAGVQILAMDCRITPDGMEINTPVPVELTAH